MKPAVPAWVVSNAESLIEEAAPYIDMTPEERILDLRAACRAAERILRSRSDAERVLRHIDPLPASSEVLLARLRQQYRDRARGRR